MFIPLISKNYLDSKFCLVELGYAYSKFVNEKNRYHIFPFSIVPITKSQALLNTPLSYLQTEALNDIDAIHNFTRILIKEKLMNDNGSINEESGEFILNLNKIIMKNENIIGNAVVVPICSDISNPDAIQHIQNDNKHIINFNLFANKKSVRPDFISLVLKFPGTFNFYHFLRANADISLVFDINNYTESLTDIDIEFKYHETHQLLKKHKYMLHSGMNHIEVPIHEMNIEGLKQISEICFVAWNNYIIEEEGMFSIENVQIK